MKKKLRLLLLVNLIGAAGILAVLLWSLEVQQKKNRQLWEQQMEQEQSEVLPFMSANRKKTAVSGEIKGTILLSRKVSEMEMPYRRLEDDLFLENQDAFHVGAGEFFSGEIAFEQPREKLLAMECIYQLPELPTGCEITALTMLLRYYGFDADKCDLADNYLKKGKAGVDSPFERFIGDPRVVGSYGCFAKAITDAANKYLKEQKSDYTAKEISGSTLSELFTWLDQDIPVVVWANSGMKLSAYSVKWVIDGETIVWRGAQHCMVFIGYSLEERTVTVADPQKGIQVYDMEAFYKCYEEQYKQAVILVKE